MSRLYKARGFELHIRSIACFLLLIVAAVAIVIATTRLAPESSPISRGTAHAAANRCEDKLCLSELRNDDNQPCKVVAENISCDDIATYWKAIRLRRNIQDRLEIAPHNRLLQGEYLARSYNCFRCHGELGQGGIANAGALKGYIPGYFGRDFRALTNGARHAVVREWIKTGNSRSITDPLLTGFVAAFFLERQAVSMPQFSTLADNEIDLLTDYVIALNRFGPLDAEGLTRYAIATVSTGTNSYRDGFCESSFRTFRALSRKNFGHTSSLNGTSFMSVMIRSRDRPMGK